MAVTARSAERGGGRVAPLPGTGGRFAVIDIGSNSVRLVVYEGLVRAPLPIFNEKILAGLGSGLGATGQLDADGMARALAAIERFVAVSRALGAGLPEIVATAAVRDARNGKEFVVVAEQRAGGRLRVLRGREEARYSALGVVASFPGADGLVADLGGGSLEFMLVDNGVPGEGFTLPLGPLRLIGESRGRAREIVDAAFARIDWLWEQTRGRDFYAVGGAWRNFARVDMARGKHLLHVVHHYTMDRDRALSLAELLSGLTDRSMKGIAGISRRRQAALPMAAMVLGRAVAVSRAKRVVFSGAGLREGVVHDRLPAAEAARDPLLAAATRMAERAGRTGEHGAELQEWLAPLYDERTDRRLVNAACLLSDVGWAVHPDYRAEQAMATILHAPLVGIDHPGRAFVAQAVAIRYGARGSGLWMAEAAALLDAETQARAERLGHALRLGATLSGGGSGVLPRTSLDSDETTVTLTLPPGMGAFAGEKVERRLATLAAALGKEPKLELGA